VHIRIRTAAAVLSGLALGGAACAGGAGGAGAAEVNPPERRSTNLPRPRDPDIAVQEELDAARRAGTIAAYDLFLARNGSHPLSETAERERAAIAARAGK
jgi:hypothetical protein